MQLRAGNWATAGYAIGIAIGASATTIGTAKGFASAFKITSKISSQMAKRGWTNQLIKETILKNVGRKAFNKQPGMLQPHISLLQGRML